MVLNISKDLALSDISDINNPITTQHEISGTTVEVLVYLFNDKPEKRYESIQIVPIDLSGTDESSWIELALDNSGTAGTYVSTLSVPDISDSGVPKPIWVKITSAIVPDSVNKTDIALKITCREFAV